MKLTEDDIVINIDDEYYFRESNVCVLVQQKNVSGETIKKQILDNQEKLEKIIEICKYHPDTWLNLKEILNT